MDASSGLLWQCPLVITNIFKYLCARDLSSCAKVCSLWNSMSIDENNRRRFVEWFLEIGIGQMVKQDGQLVNPTPPARVLYPFQQQLASVKARPRLCLAFVTKDTQEHIMNTRLSHPMTRKRAKKDIHHWSRTRIKDFKNTFLSPFLPVQCQINCFTAPGIIGCQGNGSPAEVKEGQAISGLLLPNFPGTYIQHCSIDSVEKWLSETCLSEEVPGRPIKGLLMFVSCHSEWLLRGCIKECIKHNEGKEFMFLGASLEPVSDSLGSCFVFSGENVEAASVVIDSTTNDVACELELFKKTGLLKNQCFAFMFPCVDKEINKDLISNFESNIFRNMYPDVSLTGCFVYKNIGYHFLPNVDKDDPDHKQRCQKFPSFMHKNIGCHFLPNVDKGHPDLKQICQKFPLNQCVPKNSTIFVLFSVKTPK